MKKGKRKDVATEVLEEAQRILEVAAAGGEFARFADVDNNRAGHADLRRAALEILADQFKDCDVEIVAYPNSEYVDIQVVPQLLEPEEETQPVTAR